MPSPVGHALGGVIIGLLSAPIQPHRSSAPQSGPPHMWQMKQHGVLLLAAAAAVAPDLDFLWGRHTMETHSLGAALAAALLVLVCTGGRGSRLAVIVGLSWASHVLFDWLGSDTTPPLGVTALWPFSSAFYFADAFVFEAISRRTHLPNFWSHNLWAVARELLLLGPIAAGLAWRRWGRQLGDGGEGDSRG